MRRRRLVAPLLALGLSAALLTPATAASATPSPDAGNRSLAEVLTSDGNRFDRNFRDFDIVTEAVLAVLEAKPESPVGVLTDGDTALTAFLPNDRSFQLLVKDLTGKRIHREGRIFHRVASLGIDTVEDVLLYHVVPGATITSADAVQSDGAELTTALGPPITVRVYDRRLPLVRLKDQDRNDIDPFLIPWRLDINQGNAQIAHGIFLVLRPVDL